MLILRGYELLITNYIDFYSKLPFKNLLLLLHFLNPTYVCFGQGLCAAPLAKTHITSSQCANPNTIDWLPWTCDIGLSVKLACT